MWKIVVLEELQPVSSSAEPPAFGSVEMPQRTAAPLILATGLALLAAGLAFGWAMSLVGAVVLVAGLLAWVRNLVSARGHVREPWVEPADRARAIGSARIAVERLVQGKPGYRVQLPTHVHPISAGIKGGLLGGLVMPIPALLYGWLSGQGLWYAVNLLAGMAIPGISNLSARELGAFHGNYFLVAIVIHAATSLAAGLAYGVLLPMLPDIPKAFAWGGLLMPVLWTAVSFVALLRINPALDQKLDWPSFILAQFVFGIATAFWVTQFGKWGSLLAGVLGGLVGGALMIAPAALWAWITGHSIWFPANVLAAMVLPQVGAHSIAELQQYHADWFVTAAMIHVSVSMIFGVIYGWLLPRLPNIPGPMSWGALLMPLVWTSVSYSLMGVVNPILQQNVNWQWFIVSQFIFGIVASIVVVRSEEIFLPPVGRGPTADQPPDTTAPSTASAGGSP
ncbi:MAG TPA: hypothetical protein VFE24_08795 [Pirellulales bacterium]|nr:hypothetical protein [Pirellulales bacterium]